MSKTMEVGFSAKDFHAKVIEIAQRHPHAYYINEDGYCSYIDGTAFDKETGWTASGCLFGQALMELGMDREDLESIEKFFTVITIRRLANLTGLEFNTSWSDVQRSQDTGEEWGDAITPMVEYWEDHYADAVHA